MTLSTPTDVSQFVVFTVHDQLYSLSIEEVVEILRVPMITEVPAIDKMIEGVINIRGNIIPVISLHRRFVVPTAKKHKKNRIVVVQGTNEHIGLMVDEVKMVTTFHENSIEPPSGVMMQEDVLKGYAKSDSCVIGLLDLEKVLYHRKSVE